jgi:hypothetical protein
MRRSRCLIYTVSSGGFHDTANSIISKISREPTQENPAGAHYEDPAPILFAVFRPKLRRIADQEFRACER